MWKKIKEIIKRNNLVVSLYVGYKRLLDIMKDYCYLRSKADFCEKRKNRKEKYLIVRRKGAKGNGIFSDWFYFLPSFELAEKTGRIPVVDMEHYENPYTDINRGGNVWLYFFTECVEGKSLELAERSGRARYIYRNLDIVDLYRILQNDSCEILRWNRLFKKYIHLNKDMETLFQKEYSLLFGSIYHAGEKILGVKIRGTDYNSTKPKDHCIQPSASEMIKYAGKIMKEEQYEYLYLATEDANVARQFMQAFGEKLLLRDGNRLGDRHLYSHSAAEEAARKYGKVKSGADYILEVYLLAKTSALLTSGNSGSVMALIINGGLYEKVWFVDKGKY